jgi:hypothetical protein
MSRTAKVKAAVMPKKSNQTGPISSELVYARRGHLRPDLVKTGGALPETSDDHEWMTTHERGKARYLSIAIEMT